MDFPYSRFATSVNYQLDDNGRLRDIRTETRHSAFPIDRAAVTAHEVIHKEIIAVVANGAANPELEDWVWRIETNLAVRLHTTFRSIAHHARVTLNPYEKGPDPARPTIPEFPSRAEQARLFGGIQMTPPPFFLTICPDMVDKFNPYVAVGTFMGIRQLLDMVRVHANKCLAWHDTLFTRLENRTDPANFHPTRIRLNHNDDQVGDSEPMVVRFDPKPLPIRFMGPAPPPDYESFREDAYTHSSYTFNGFSIAIGARAESAKMRGQADNEEGPPPPLFSPLSPELVAPAPLPRVSPVHQPGQTTDSLPHDSSHSPLHDPEDFAATYFGPRLRLQVTSYADDLVYRLQAGNQTIVLPNSSISSSSPGANSSRNLELVSVAVPSNDNDHPPPLLEFDLDTPTPRPITPPTVGLHNDTTNSGGSLDPGGSASAPSARNLARIILRELEDIKRAVTTMNGEREEGNSAADSSLAGGISPGPEGSPGRRGRGNRARRGRGRASPYRLAE